jgi:hypothetical protein
LSAHNSKETGEIFRILPRKSARGIRPSDSGDNLVVLGFLCKQPISSLVTSVLLGVEKVMWLIWFKTSLSSSRIFIPRSKISYPRVWYQQVLSPSRRREAPCEGTNSPRLFTPGETKALAESKVHQISRAWVNNDGWSSSLISKIWRTVMNIAETDWSNLKFAL